MLQEDFLVRIYLMSNVLRWKGYNAVASQTVFVERISTADLQKLTFEPPACLS